MEGQLDPENLDQVRSGINIGLLKTFDPNIDEDAARSKLLELYRHVHTALQLWIGERDPTPRAKSETARNGSSGL